MQLLPLRFNPSYHLRSFNERDMATLFSSYGFVCRGVFKILQQKRVPPPVERMLRILGETKRAVLHQPSSPMRVNTVCPACGYSGGTSPLGAAADDHGITPGMRVRSLLAIALGWRWIAAVYERVLS